jgi:hypothetical protein
LTRRHHPALPILAGLAAACSGGQAPTTQPAPGTAVPNVAAATLKADLYAFADDSMEGREAGTRGNFKGTTWIAAQAEKLGLTPAGENGTWFQVIPLVERGVDRNSTLSAGGTTLELNQDFVSFSGIPQLGFAPTLKGDNIPSIFGGRLGDSTAIPAEQLEGKVVVVLPPLGTAGQPSWQFWTKLDKRYAKAAALAVVGVELLPPPVVEYLARSQMTLKGDGPKPNAGGKLYCIMLSEAGTEKILGANPASLQPGAAGRPVTANVGMGDGDVQAPARNVVALLPGSDPALKAEYVAIGAHNDHIGISRTPVDQDSLWAFNNVVRPAGAESEMRPAKPDEAARIQVILDSLRKIRKPRLDSIRNGADDDGSGTVTVLGVAEALTKAKIRPKRSILFVWHTGEEKGLWGSKYFTEHPTVPRDAIVAQLNLDMVGRGGPNDMVLGTPGTVGGPNYLQLVGSRRLSTELGDLVEKVNTDGKFGLAFDYTLDGDGHPANIYCRSDHYMYARWGIPVVFFTTGVHQDYHEITDEVQFINFGKMARISTFVAHVALQVANADHRMIVDQPKPDPNGQCQQ